MESNVLVEAAQVFVLNFSSSCNKKSGRFIAAELVEFQDGRIAHAIPPCHLHDRGEGYNVIS